VGTYDVVRSRTGQPLLSDTIRQRRLSFFAHLCHADTGQDRSRALRACIRGPPKDWRRRTGRPRQTWLRTVEDDLRPLNFGLVTARRRAMDRPARRLLVDAATSSWHAPERECVGNGNPWMCNQWNDVLLFVVNNNKRINRLETFQWRRHMSRLILLPLPMLSTLPLSENLSMFMKTLSLRMITNRLHKTLSTLATIVTENGDCRQIRRLSPKTTTVAKFGDSRRFRRQIVSVFGDYSRQCGQGLTLLYKCTRRKGTDAGDHIILQAFLCTSDSDNQPALDPQLITFSARQRICHSALYTITRPSVRLSVRPSHGWMSQRRLK